MGIGINGSLNKSLELLDNTAVKLLAAIEKHKNSPTGRKFLKHFFQLPVQKVNQRGY